MAFTISGKYGPINMPTEAAPAFHVYTNDTSGYFAANAGTKVRFNVKTFDTANCFDTSTYKFTPNVAGYYSLTFKVLGAWAAGGQVINILYKNGSNFSELSQTTYSQTAMNTAGSTLVYANGTTDYFEAYFYQDKIAGGNIYTGSNQTYFCGFLVRAA